MSSYRKRTREASDSCRRSGGAPLADYAAVVHAYTLEYRENANRLLRLYGSIPDYGRALALIAEGKHPSGTKRHDHQRMVRGVALQEAREQLVAASADLRRCESFRELYDLVEHHIGRIFGIGPLTVYDVAQRLGAHVGLEPEEVYLHSGAAEGASYLGIARGRNRLAMEELPKPFSRLRPHEVEDCLCIYKDDLKRIAAKGVGLA